MATRSPHHKRLWAEAASMQQLVINGSGVSGAMSGKAKPCLKFFSTCGCPYGEGCHFAHYVPGGFSTLGLGPVNSGYPSLPVPSSDARLNLGGFKTRVCNQFGTPEGCRFGDKCHFAHGERELRKVNGSGSEISGHVSSNLGVASLSSETSRVFAAIKAVSSINSLPAGLPPREPSPPGITTSLGASSAVKDSLNSAMVAGTIIGKGGNRAIEFIHLPGATWDHEKYPSLRNNAIEGTFDQFENANQMVKDLLMRKDPLPPKFTGFSSHKYKTKMCENFARGTCTFGERCHFAHGDAELRNPPSPT